MSTPALKDYRLDRDANEPLWMQLATVLRTAIKDGLLRPDQALPSESELIDRFGVSRTVVREALAELVRRGLIYKIRAKGSFVAPVSPDLSFIGSTLGSSADLTASGRTSSTRVLEQEAGRADADEAAALNIPLGSDVVRLRRLRSVDGKPWLLVHTTLPRALFPGVLRANLENHSLYDHLRRHYGVSPAGADRWLQAVVPEPEEAELLQLGPGVPVLRIESVAWDATNTRFEYYRALHRSDESRFYVGIR
jgi:GntR family transcriptional regulator